MHPDAFILSYHLPNLSPPTEPTENTNRGHQYIMKESSPGRASAPGVGFSGSSVADSRIGVDVEVANFFRFAAGPERADVLCDFPSPDSFLRPHQLDFSVMAFR
eukprot:m.108260 g.108260  ORF g.108260 m.108260 type:complete len:104 (-) comp51733_c0_seq1:870-1181(-)